MCKNVWTAVISVMLLSGLLSCDKDDDNTPVNNYSAKDKEFITKATYINLGEINSGNIALQKTSNPPIVAFANMMITDHTSAHNQLKDMVQPKEQAVPSDTDQEHKNMATVLSSLSGDAFDSTYIYMMVAGHDKAIALHQDEIQNGSDQELKNFASGKLPVIQHHRMVADSLAHALFP
jgi:putative membrane protein